MLSKIQRQQEEDFEEGKAKSLLTQHSIEEIRKFNADMLIRKQEVQRLIKNEDEAVHAYQVKKAEHWKRREKRKRSDDMR